MVDPAFYESKWPTLTEIAVCILPFVWPCALWHWLRRFRRVRRAEREAFVEEVRP